MRNTSEWVRNLNSKLEAIRLQRKELKAYASDTAPYIERTPYTREVTTPTQWKALQAELRIKGQVYRVKKELEAARAWLIGRDLHNADTLDGVHLPSRLLPAIEMDTYKFSAEEWQFVRTRLEYDYALSTRFSTCPITGHSLLTLGRTSAVHPSTKLLQEGAVYHQTFGWFRNQDELQKTYPVKKVRVVANGELQDRWSTDAELSTFIGIKKGDHSIYVIPGRQVGNYHSSRQDGFLALDPDVVRTTGLELEFNRGRTSSAGRDTLAAKIIALSDGKLKVERDGSVSGFEVVTPHGRPSSLRNLLGPIFAEGLFDELAVGMHTGGHVHVTTLEGEQEKLSDRRGVLLHNLLSPMYREMAGRRNNRYAVAYSRPTYNRYSEIQLCEDLPTCEFRLFKMNRSLARLIRNAQFAWSYVEFLKHIHEETILGDFWDFVADQPRAETLELRAWGRAHGYTTALARGELRRTYKELNLTAAVA